MTDDQPTRDMAIVTVADRQPPSTIAVVAIIMATALAISLIAFAIGAVIALDDRHLTLSDGAIALLTTSIGALIGILGTYIGVSRGHELATNGAQHDGP